MAKPDFMVMVADLYRQRRRRQARRRPHPHPPEPQEHLENVFYLPAQFTNYANLLNYLSTDTYLAFNISP